MRKRSEKPEAERPARRSACPINAGLEIFGDAWSLLIVRDLLFKGRCRFQEFLDGGEGIATNILADRLKKLQAHDIVTRRRDVLDARRIAYALTEKGFDLAPMLVEMILWAARYEDTAAQPATLRKMSRDRAGYISNLRAALGGPPPRR